VYEYVGRLGSRCVWQQTPSEAETVAAADRGLMAPSVGQNPEVGPAGRLCTAPFLKGLFCISAPVPTCGASSTLLYYDGTMALHRARLAKCPAPSCLANPLPGNGPALDGLAASASPRRRSVDTPYGTPAGLCCQQTTVIKRSVRARQVTGSAPELSVEQSTAKHIALIQRLTKADSGKYFSAAKDGEELPY